MNRENLEVERSRYTIMKDGYGWGRQLISKKTTLNQL